MQRKPINITFTDEEIQVIDRAVKNRGVSRAVFIRSLAVIEARRINAEVKQ